jgi:hypothetical protein
MLLKKHSITPYDDTIISYLDHLIRAETRMVDAAGASTEQLNMLKRYHDEYQQIIRLLERQMVPDANIESLGEDGVKQLLRHLYTLKHWGKKLHDLITDTGSAGMSTYREQPCHISKVKENSTSSWW